MADPREDWHTVAEFDPRYYAVRMQVRPYGTAPAPGRSVMGGGGGAAPQAPASADPAGAEPPRDAWLRLRWAAACLLGCPRDPASDAEAVWLERLREAIDASGRKPVPAELPAAELGDVSKPRGAAYLALLEEHRAAIQYLRCCHVTGSRENPPSQDWDAIERTGQAHVAAHEAAHKALQSVPGYAEDPPQRPPQRSAAGEALAKPSSPFPCGPGLHGDWHRSDGCLRCGYCGCLWDDRNRPES